MIAAAVTLDDLELSLTGSRVWFRAEGSRHELVTTAVGEAAALDVLDAVAAELARGSSVAQAISSAARPTPTARQMAVTSVERGAVILDDNHMATREDVAAALRTLVQVAPADSRTVAVLGRFDADPVSYVEEHDAIGRLVVRLNVAKLVAVGSGARHLQSAAGLEGSWDGESVIVDSPEEAYDLLRDEIRGSDVVLVKGAQPSLAPLVDRLIAPGALR